MPPQIVDVQLHVLLLDHFLICSCHAISSIYEVKLGGVRVGLLDVGELVIVIGVEYKRQRIIGRAHLIIVSDTTRIVVSQFQLFELLLVVISILLDLRHRARPLLPKLLDLMS